MQRGGQIFTRQLLFRISCHAAAHKERAVKWAAGAADAGDQGHAGGLQNVADVFVGDAGQLLQDFAKTAIHVDAMVGIADGRIKLGQIGSVFIHHGCRRFQPLNDLISSDCHFGEPSL